MIYIKGSKEKYTVSNRLHKERVLIDRGKGSKTLNEVMNQKQIEVAPLHKQQGHRILPNYRNATHVREIVCVNYVFQISLTKSKNIRRI